MSRLSRASGHWSRGDVVTWSSTSSASAGPDQNVSCLSVCPVRRRHLASPVLANQPYHFKESAALPTCLPPQPQQHHVYSVAGPRHTLTRRSKGQKSRSHGNENRPVWSGRMAARGCCGHCVTASCRREIRMLCDCLSLYRPS